jgi:hypothetical protein
MLTAKQIEVVRSVITNNDDVYEDTARTVLELAAAYLRVAALLARFDSDPGRGSVAWDECVKPWVDELRRALEG